MVNKIGQTISSDVFAIKEDVLYVEYETQLDRAHAEWIAKFYFPGKIVKKVIECNDFKDHDCIERLYPVEELCLTDVFKNEYEFMNAINEFVMKDTSFKCAKIETARKCIRHYDILSDEYACVYATFSGSGLVHPRKMSDVGIEYAFMKLAVEAQKVFANLTLVLVEADMLQPEQTTEGR